MTEPVRIQLRRTRGYRLQEASTAINGLPAVKVDRTSKWGNPFKTSVDGTAAECVELYNYLIAGFVSLTSSASFEDQQKVQDIIWQQVKDLRGKNLACWCRADKPCHADTLLKIANRSDK